LASIASTEVTAVRSERVTTNGTVQRLYLLNLGYQDITRTILLKDGGDKVVRCPTTAALVQCEDGWFLLDTGLSRAVAEDPTVADLWFPWGPPGYPGRGDPLLEALALCGIATADITGVAISHLHADHAGGLGHFVDGPPIFVHQAELDFAIGPAGPSDGYYRPEYELDGVRWQTLDASAGIADGVTAIATPGHTPGHMSFRVETPGSGTWLLAFDAILTSDNVRLGQTGGRTSPPGAEERLRCSQEKLIALAGRTGARLIPGHCPETWPRLRTAPEHYS
jgi:N-acyl homoserine lactone hydrolase